MTPVFALEPPRSSMASGQCTTRRDETHELGEAIADLAARLHAATYELLVMLREFDAQAGWNNGFLSCAHWLHWRTGIDLGACREKVRVAKALATLPVASAAMQHGAISYAKVRALTRVATPANERRLVDVALAGTASQVERFVRAWRRVDRAEAATQANARHLGRHLSTWVDDDGMVVIRGRLTPEIGAVVQRALEAAADHLFREASGAPAGPTLCEEVTARQRRADALGLLAETALSADLDRGTGGDRYQVILHVDADEPAHAHGSARTASTVKPFDGVLETDSGATYVSAETSQRLACDSSVIEMRHDGGGTVLDVGRKTRTVPPSIRRALTARDRGCRFPGCTSRRCDAHHVTHWADGGATSLDNLMLVCRRHHRALHEGGFSVVRHGDDTVTFYRPDGAVVEEVSAVARIARLPLPPAGRLPVWDGTPLNLGWAIDVLRRP